MSAASGQGATDRILNAGCIGDRLDAAALEDVDGIDRFRDGEMPRSSASSETEPSHLVDQASSLGCGRPRLAILCATQAWAVEFMRITIVIEHFVPTSGGAEGMAIAVVRGLIRRGHDIQVVARTGKPLEGCPLHIIKGGDYVGTAASVAGGGLVVDWGLRIPADLHRLGGGLTRAFLDYKALPVHPAIRWLKRLLDRSSTKHRRSIRQQELLLRRPETRFVAVSEFVAKQVREHFPAAAERLCVIHNGVDVKRFCPENRERWRTKMRLIWGVPENAVLFMFVAHNPRLKNFQLLARVFRRLHTEIPQARLAVVGKHRVPCMGEPWLVYVGGADEPEKAYAAADALLHPTFYDACANVVLEGLASGLPVVSSDFNGSAELITSGTDGFVLPVHGGSYAHRVAEWSELVGRLATDSDLRCRISKEARRTAERHTMGAYIDRLQRVFCETAVQVNKVPEGYR